MRAGGGDPGTYEARYALDVPEVVGAAAEAMGRLQGPRRRVLHQPRLRDRGRRPQGGRGEAGGQVRGDALTGTRPWTRSGAPRTSAESSCRSSRTRSDSSRSRPPPYKYNHPSSSAGRGSATAVPLRATPACSSCLWREQRKLSV